jgi:AcrR family transcriptional regulator
MEQTLRLSIAMPDVLPNNLNKDTHKRLRVDAARNKARILDAAEKVFTKEGLTASTERVAMQAGVGIGTIFRHFPTKELLLRAVLDRQITTLVADAHHLVVTSNHTSEAFFSFLRQAFELVGTKKLIVSALEETGSPITLDTSNRIKLLKDLDILLKRAQSNGEVRDDISLDELLALMQGLLQSSKYIQSDKPAREHVLGIVLDGLRPTSVSQ